MSTVLDDIISGVREDLAIRQRTLSAATVAEAACARSAVLDAIAVLRAPGPVKVIAEIKRRSPSKGDLASITDPARLAAAYEAGGATAISVLTERRRFGGSFEDLDAVRADVSIPVLCKDFMVDSYQIDEARAHGANIILLIVAALDDALLCDLYQHATELSMASLIEVHNEVEIERALTLGGQVIGVNARNLKTLKVDRATFARLAPLIPRDRVRVAESGIRSPADVANYVTTDADALLVGEALVTEGDPQLAITELIGSVRS